MIKRWRRFSAGILFLILACGLWYLCLPKPVLKLSVPYSQALYDDQHRLLRLTRARDGQYRLFTPLNHISPNLIKATLLQEDRYFYDHPAVNPFALVRAAFDTYVLRKRRYGGSTITMQLARMRFHITSNTIGGKLKQIYHAFQLERHYSKNQILEAYLNRAPYGGNVSGVAAASLIYFNQPIKQLTLPQALTLSVIPQNPAKRRPVTHNHYLRQARDRLFQHWGKAYPHDKKLAYLFQLPFQIDTDAQLPFLAPHFSNYVISQITLPHTLNTTLDLPMQQQIQQSITDYLQQVAPYNITNAAALLIDNRSMAIKAYVGSSDFYNTSILGQVDGVTAPRSPGSTLKPFIYALAIQQGLITPMSILKDIPQSFSGYRPQDFDDHYLGPITAQDALILSRNIPAVSLEQQLQPTNLYALLHQSGVPLKPEPHYGLSITLGGADITMLKLGELYAMLANRGDFQSVHMLQNQTNASTQPLVSPSASFITLDMLTHNTAPSPMLTPSPTLPVAWKTGTSAGYSDAWAAGDFGHYTLVVWLGNFNGAGNPALVGMTMAGPLFFNIVDRIQQQHPMYKTRGLDHSNLSVIRVTVCKASGKLATAICPDKIKTWFIPGVSPIKKDDIYRWVAIDPNTQKRTCHINKHTQFKAIAFWPSDLQQAFAAAGLPRKIPPPFERHCNFSDAQGMAPHITSPIAHVIYDIAQHPQIALTASADADVHTLYWFANQTYLGKSTPNNPLLWHAQSGTPQITVVDNDGRSNSQSIHVIN
ncbi:MAG: penicillin-binding protein 1C [Coxiella sp. (in: Bacteria)]|nr:MAG: penicillin-binding protein 1C [Coxiella sp. (in: g-proteobacteria)]